MCKITVHLENMCTPLWNASFHLTDMMQFGKEKCYLSSWGSILTLCKVLLFDQSKGKGEGPHVNFSTSWK
jgi:hypothetical protein